MKLGVAWGPLLLLAWQIAPVQAHPDSTGRVRLSFGYGGGQYENRTFDCNGALSSATPVPYRTGGAQLDVWHGSRFRLSAFGGHLSSSHPDYRGFFGGGLGAFEGGIVGIGAGAAVLPRDGGLLAPSVYLRVGRMDHLHFRTDLIYPEPTFGTTGVFRAGLGFNQGRLRGISGFGGLSLGMDADGHEGGGGFAQVSIPAWQRLDVLIQASAHSSAQHPVWGLSGVFNITSIPRISGPTNLHS